MIRAASMAAWDHEVSVPVVGRCLAGTLALPPAARGVVVFAHGSGSGRFSPRNQFVARALQQAGLATLLLDLLDEDEARECDHVIDIPLLAGRLEDAAVWLARQPATCRFPLGFFGASTGAAAALVAAARRPEFVRAVVSRGGRPDLAGVYLPRVTAPTLLVVGGNDKVVLEPNRDSLQRLGGPGQLVVVPGASHLFSEPGTLEQVADLARSWFLDFLASESADDPPRFRDRADAACRLAERLKGRSLRQPVVLAIPRGGVVTGAVLARELGADLDVALAHKLRTPGQPEVALGAVAETGELYLNVPQEEFDERLQCYVKEERRYQMAEIARRRQALRGLRPRLPLAGRSVIVTDDGIATGATMIAALQSLRSEQPHEVIVAVPVASPDRLAEVRRWCDAMVYLHAPADFSAVGQFYDDFAAVDDATVVALLNQFGVARSRGQAPSDLSRN